MKFHIAFLLYLKKHSVRHHRFKFACEIFYFACTVQCLGRTPSVCTYIYFVFLNDVRLCESLSGFCTTHETKATKRFFFALAFGFDSTNSNDSDNDDGDNNTQALQHRSHSHCHFGIFIEQNARQYKKPTTSQSKANSRSEAAAAAIDVVYTYTCAQSLPLSRSTIGSQSESRLSGVHNVHARIRYSRIKFSLVFFSRCFFDDFQLKKS